MSRDYCGPLGVEDEQALRVVGAREQATVAQIDKPASERRVQIDTVAHLPAGHSPNHARRCVAEPQGSAPQNHVVVRHDAGRARPQHLRFDGIRATWACRELDDHMGRAPVANRSPPGVRSIRSGQRTRFVARTIDHDKAERHEQVSPMGGQAVQMGQVVQATRHGARVGIDLVQWRGVGQSEHRCQHLRFSRTPHPRDIATAIHPQHRVCEGRDHPPLVPHAGNLVKPREQSVLDTRDCFKTAIEHRDAVVVGDEDLVSGDRDAMQSPRAPPSVRIDASVRALGQLTHRAHRDGVVTDVEQQESTTARVGRRVSYDRRRKDLHRDTVTEIQQLNLDPCSPCCNYHDYFVLIDDWGWHMPFIQVTMLTGHPQELKHDLMRGIADATIKAMGCKPDSVRITINEVPAEDWSRGGEPISAKMQREE